MTTLRNRLLKIVFWNTPRSLRVFLRDRVLSQASVARIRGAVEAAAGASPHDAQPPQALSGHTRPTAKVRHGPADSSGNGQLAQKLEDKLWGGFSKQALADLEALKVHPRSDAAEVSHAAWALARWHFAQGDLIRARHEVLLTRLANRNHSAPVAQALLEAECLMALDAHDEARVVLEHARRGRESDPHLALAMANSFARPDGTQDDIRLSWLNQVLLAANLVPLVRPDPAAPLAIDTLATAPICGLTPPEKQPLVSVLVPAHTAKDTLHLALDSLLAQTWHNIEIIVVDDCSPDDTFAVAQRYAHADSRVRALQQDENRGAYAARNHARRAARGEFVTVHDADDWSHPQKIEIQARHLMQVPAHTANLTHWVRATRNLVFRGTTRPSGKLVQLNHSSLMLRREVLAALCGWDDVRIAADSELIRRIEHYHGPASVHRLLPQVPLGFALEEGSLTRSGLTHVHTLYHGVRREYHAASRHWLTTLGDEVPALSASERSFPATGFILPRKRVLLELDLMFILDFNLSGGAYVSTMNYVEAALARGLRVGLFHWRRYDLDVARPLRPEIRQMAQEGRVHVVTPGEKVSAMTVIAGYPPVLQHGIDMPPELTCARFIIVTNQMSARLYSGGDVQYDPRRVRTNVELLFGVTPLWVPISGLVRELMAADGRYAPVHPEAWPPLIDTESWCARPLRWRGEKGRRAVLGRHARDHYTKWPQDPATIRDAYCADKPCDVHIMGGDARALDRLGTRPGNWQVAPFGAASPQTFLAGLDFFLHYPHEDYIEEFGRAVIEAMAVGVPVILPDVFRATFGDAALYAAPRDVWPTIEGLWEDEAAWMARAEAGRAFVAENCGREQFEARLERLRQG